ncbi:MAG TPA: SPFH domain-containing protein [Patescibacteria group bacterium]|nr:SPFH domain-containing protein [Patescibacteria group bacterium]
MSDVSHLATILGSGALAGGMAFKAIERVDQGEAAVKLRFGRAYHRWGPRKGTLIGIKGPGQYAKIPFTHGYHHINTLDRTTPLTTPSKEIQIEDSEGSQLKIDATATWFVREDGDYPAHALFRVKGGEEGLVQTVTSLCVSGLFEVTHKLSREELNSDLITKGTRTLRGDDLLYYGVELKRINLEAHAHTFGEMVKQAGALSTATMLGAISGQRSLPEGAIPNQSGDTTPDLHAV